jgi:hypothetical protein
LHRSPIAPLQSFHPDPGLFGSNPGRLVKAVFEAKGSSAGVRC